MKRLITFAACLYMALNPPHARAWDAGPLACKHQECSAMGEWRGNTHLWVVNRALDLLKKSNDKVAKMAVDRMNTPACRTQWESGLWDADDGYLAETFGLNATRATTQRLGTHFYNPTGIDAFGRKTEFTTYQLFLFGTGTTMVFGDGRLNARYRLPGMLRRPGDNLPETNAAINGVWIKPGDGVETLTDRQILEMAGFKAYYAGSFLNPTDAGNARCYDLGLALHYLTDVTEPFHASGFDAFDIPTMLHAVYEEYVPRIQTKFPVAADASWERQYVEKTGGLTPSADQVFDQVARTSNGLAPALLFTIFRSGGTCTYNPETFVLYVDGPCFVGKKEVDDTTGIVLNTAYQSVASYLWATFDDEYHYSVAGRLCPAGTQYATNGKCYEECRPGYTAYGLRCVEQCPKSGCTIQEKIYMRRAMDSKKLPKS